MIWGGRNFLSQKIRKIFFSSVAWSQLTYGILSWGRCGLGGTNKIIKAQNKVVKIIFGSSVQSTYIINRISQFQKAYDYFAAIKLYGKDNNRTKIIYLIITKLSAHSFFEADFESDALNWYY